MIPTYSNAVAQQEDRECAKEAVILALPGDAGIGISDPLIGGGASGTIVVSNLKPDANKESYMRAPNL